MFHKDGFSLQRLFQQAIHADSLAHLHPLSGFPSKIPLTDSLFLAEIGGNLIVLTAYNGTDGLGFCHMKLIHTDHRIFVTDVNAKIDSCSLLLHLILLYRRK